MNYSCVIWGGLTTIVAVWWFVGASKGYIGPQTTGGISAEIDNARKASVQAKRSEA